LLVGFKKPKTSVDANALFTKAREFISKWGNFPAPSDKFPAGNRWKHGLMAAVPLPSFGDVMHSSPSQTPQESSCPVVVVGGSVAGLGVARSLAAARTSVVVLDTSPFNAALRSRHCVGRVIASLSGKPLIDELKVLARSFTQPPLLVLTQDAAVEAVSQWRAELEPCYRFLLPSELTVDLLNNKGKFHDFAKQQGFPVPRGVVVTAASGLAGLDQIAAPVVVKPARKTALQHPGLDRATRFDSMDEAKAHCAALLKQNADAIVQRWIEGPDHGIYFCLFFCDGTGQPLRIFTGRKLSAYPPGVGSTATCVAAPEVRAELEALTVRLTTRVKFAGMGGLEFKRNEHTGQFVIIEPTVGRTDWQEEIAALSGVNIPMAALAFARGRPVAPAAVGAEAIAWRASLKHRAPQGLRRAGSRIVDGYWRADDPVPGLIFYAVEPVRRLINRGISGVQSGTAGTPFNPKQKLPLGG
jgi:D-aspartate ligase